jgi:hypothetical protein
MRIVCSGRCGRSLFSRPQCLAASTGAPPSAPRHAASNDARKLARTVVPEGAQPVWNGIA